MSRLSEGDAQDLWTFGIYRRQHGMDSSHLGAQVAAELVKGLSIPLAGPSPATDRRLHAARDRLPLGLESHPGLVINWWYERHAA